MDKKALSQIYRKEIILIYGYMFATLFKITGVAIYWCVPYNSFVENNAYKQYKCALKCLFG